MMIKPKQIITRAVDTVGNLLLSPPFGGQGQIINHGSRLYPRIALTFDDGPSEPCTDELLDAMARLDVKGTFFCVGVNVAWHPDTVARAFKEGHIIGNHSMEHSRKAGLNLRGAAHIEKGAAQISQVIGCQPRLYRPPWGWLTPWEGRRLHQHNYTIVGWDVYTHDWHWPEWDGRVVAKDAIAHTRPGSILLLHDANAGVKHWDKKETVRAVEEIVPALRAKGYEFVTVPELLNVSAYDTPTGSSEVKFESRAYS